MKIVEVEISQLKPAEYNPRSATAKEFSDLKKSLEKFGFVVPVLVNSAPERKNIIIGGHFRVKVAQSMGIKTVPVVYKEIQSVDEERELNLRLNKNSGAWDWDALADMEHDLLIQSGFDAEFLADKFGADAFDLGADESESNVVRKEFAVCENCGHETEIKKKRGKRK